MITFNNVRFKNFGSFGNYFTEINLGGKTTTLVTGANGHGKSYALLDSITFALFGKPFRRINIPQLINSINNKDCLVELSFSVGTHEYKIIRGLNPKIFEIYKDGKLLDQNAKAKDYQRMLEEQVVRMNYKTFTQIVTLGSSSFIPFMQLSASERRSVIEDILDLNVFSLMNDVLKEKRSLLREKINKIDSAVSTVKEKINLQKNHIESLKEKGKETLENNQSKIEESQSKIEEFQNKITSSENKIKDLEVNIEDRSSIKNSLSKLEELESQMKRNMKSIKKEISFFNTNTSCPTCDQPIDSSFCDEKTSNLEKNITDLHLGLEKIDDSIVEKKETLFSYQDFINKIKVIQGEITNYNSSVSAIFKYIKKIQDENNELQLSDYDVSAEVSQLEDFNSELESFLDEKESVLSTRSEYQFMTTLLKDSGIKAKIIKHYLPIMNKLINKNLTEMDFFVQFTLDEEFNETIKSRFRDNFTYMSFSEGEKMRIDLALLLAWREVAKLKNSASCNLLILDEIFDSSLDSVGTDDLMKILDGLSQKNNIFVISHKADQLVDKFKNHIKFKKVNNFSRMK